MFLYIWFPLYMLHRLEEGNKEGKKLRIISWLFFGSLGRSGNLTCGVRSKEVTVQDAAKTTDTEQPTASEPLSRGRRCHGRIYRSTWTSRGEHHLFPGVNFLQSGQNVWDLHAVSDGEREEARERKGTAGAEIRHPQPSNNPASVGHGGIQGAPKDATWD